jgi:hypothetical protein
MIRPFHSGPVFRLVGEQYGHHGNGEPASRCSRASA